MVEVAQQPGDVPHASDLDAGGALMEVLGWIGFVFLAGVAVRGAYLAWKTMFGEIGLDD